MIENPLATGRKKLGLGRREFSLVAGVPYELVLKTELGYVMSLNPRLADFLRAAGCRGDPETEYADWRRSAGEEIGKAAKER